MRMKIILGIIIIILLCFFTGSCLQKKNQLVRIEEQGTGEQNKVDDPVVMDETEMEFYSKVKDILKNSGIYPYDTPLEAHYHDFTLENMDGENISLSDFDGQTILLNFWATWCGPCIQEMPSMEKLYKELNDEGFVIVAVDIRDSKESVEKIITKTAITFPVLLDKSGKIGKIYGASSIPLSYLIDTKGYVVGVALGVIQWNTDKIKEAVRFIQIRGN